MSKVIETAKAALEERLGDGFDGSVKFEIADEGALIIDQDGVREGSGEADCTLSADAETFEAILDGELNPTTAFMSGKLSVDGDMGTAMRLGSLLG
ncbi:SCP2 sterol-binding domain-containing protein [Rhodovulum sp. YNF3179]|uniref:SCP2 sterol-binding domain-containing protein n=1 Tax=Rhodovulum sp. YNF3179 TaxID=3425127 RepID=UPI003D3486A2